MDERTNNTSLKDHANHDATDLAYLREKGYDDAEILAIWDRDAAQCKGPQTHANSEAFDIVGYLNA